MKKEELDMLDYNLPANVASAQECTGLMQIPPDREEEYDSYQELYTTESKKE